MQILDRNNKTEEEYITTNSYKGNHTKSMKCTNKHTTKAKQLSLQINELTFVISKNQIKIVIWMLMIAITIHFMQWRCCSLVKTDNDHGKSEFVKCCVRVKRFHRINTNWHQGINWYSKYVLMIRSNVNCYNYLLMHVSYYHCMFYTTPHISFD